MIHVNRGTTSLGVFAEQEVREGLSAGRFALTDIGWREGMAGLSDSQIWRPFLIAIGIVALVLGGFKARAFTICLAISLAIAGMVTSALKSSVGRHRPKHVQIVRMSAISAARCWATRSHVSRNFLGTK